MRIFLALLALTATGTGFAAEPTTPRGVVFAYECEQVNDLGLGFTCHFDPPQLTFRLNSRENMSPALRKRADYEFNKLGLRFIELGGKTFEVVADYWEKGQRRLCSRTSTGNSFGCSDYAAD